MPRDAGPDIARLQSRIGHDFARRELLELALIENVQRADLNPLEEAHAYQELKDEFGLSDDQIAAALGCSVATVRSQSSRALAHLRAALSVGAGSARWPRDGKRSG